MYLCITYIAKKNMRWVKVSQLGLDVRVTWEIFKISKDQGTPQINFFRVSWSGMAFPGGSVVKNPPSNARRCRRCKVGMMPQRREWQPAPVFLPGKCHGQRSLVGYNPGGCKELDTTKQLIMHQKWDLGISRFKRCKILYCFTALKFFPQILNVLCITFYSDNVTLRLFLKRMSSWSLFIMKEEGNLVLSFSTKISALFQAEDKVLPAF